MKVVIIDNIIRGMKKQGVTKGMGKLGSDSLTVDLDGLYICLGSNSFELARIPGTKGGHRYFFLCPDCGRRCRKLYKDYYYYACGTCQKVHKSTVNRSKTDCQYYWGLAIREAKKVDPNYFPPKGYVDYDQFPSRPKRMRANTYWEHYRRFQTYVTKGIKLWLK